MPKWTAQDRKSSRLGLLLFDQFSNHCLANALEPFRAANTFLGRTAYDWTILTPGDQPVVSSSGLPVMPTARLSDDPGGDLMMVISSYGHRAHATPDNLKTLRASAGRYRVLAGLDTGSWLLAAAGLLDGYDATIHFDLLDLFGERFPEVRTRRERWVTDRDRISCGGAMAAFDLARALIAQRDGEAIALDIARLFMSGLSGRQDTGPGSTGDRQIDHCIQEMTANIETPLAIADLAARVGCGQKTLEKRFQSVFGATPQTVYRRLRLSTARDLIGNDRLSMAEIALRCGFGNPSAFSRAFRKEFGAPPSTYR